MQINWAGYGDRIKVVDITPPGVESDLHRERENPDDNKKGKNKSVLNMEEFMGRLRRSWREGRRLFRLGWGMSWWRSGMGVYGEMYNQAAKK